MAESDAFRRYRRMNLIPGLGTIGYGDALIGFLQLALSAVGLTFAVWAVIGDDDGYFGRAAYAFAAPICLFVAFRWAQASLRGPDRQRQTYDADGGSPGSTSDGGPYDVHSHGGFLGGGGDGGSSDGGGDGGGGGH